MSFHNLVIVSNTKGLKLQLGMDLSGKCAGVGNHLRLRQYPRFQIIRLGRKLEIVANTYHYLMRLVLSGQRLLESRSSGGCQVGTSLKFAQVYISISNIDNNQIRNWNSYTRTKLPCKTGRGIVIKKSVSSTWGPQNMVRDSISRNAHSPHQFYAIHFSYVKIIRDIQHGRKAFNIPNKSLPVPYQCLVSI